MRPHCKCKGDYGVGDVSLCLPTYGHGLGDLAGTWTDVAQTGAQTGFDILKGIFDPRYRPGTTFQQTAEGVSIQRATNLPGFQVGTSAFPGTVGAGMATNELFKWGAFAVIGIGLVMVAGGRGRR